jgi:hypothetical protein
VPASIKLQEEYGDDLAIIFVESQGTSPAATAKFIMKQRWFGNQAMWTNEAPFRTGTKGLPNFALLSADGKVIATGNHMTSKDRDLIDEEIKNAKAAPADTNKSFKKAWKEFNKGNYAKAMAEASKVGAKEAELAEEATSITELFEDRIQANLNRVTWLLDNGFPGDAKDRLDGLVSGLKGTDRLLAAANEIVERFDSDEMKLELEAAGKIERLLEKVYEDGKDEKLFGKLSKLATEYSSTKVGARAQKIAALGS